MLEHRLRVRAPAAPPRRSRALRGLPRWQLAGLRGHLADPLFRNAYALMMSTGANGVLGLCYWLLAARLYQPEDVGRASAAYVAMNLLAGVTALSFTGVLTRFIPQAGRWTRSLVGRAYAISVAASVILAAGFVLAASRLGASYAELGTLGAGAVFIACAAAWAVFTLQDAVLTGLRSALWVLAENALFGIIKIILLVAYAASLPHTGIYVSWMLPVLVALPLVNMLILGILVPRHARLTAGYPRPALRQLGRFLAGDYPGALAVLATGNLVPILVASRLDPRATAYFFMAWTVGGVLTLLGMNMATSLTVEGAFDAAAISANCRAALRRMVMILGPCAMAVLLLARWGLGLFGPGYAAGGAPVLEYLALGLLPQAVTELYLGVLRAQSRASLIALVQGVRCALLLGLTLALVSPLGTAGAGLAFLASQAVMAAAITPGLVRALAAGRHPDKREEREAAARAAAGAAVRAAAEAAAGRAGRAPPGPTLLGAAAAGPPPQDAPTQPLPAVTPAPARWRAWLAAVRQAPARWPRGLAAAAGISPAAAAAGALAAAGLAMFFGFLPGTSLPRMNGLGLISVLPAGSLAGVVLLSLALLAGIALPRPHPVLLGSVLAALVACLDGVTAVIEAQPRFPTAYQIAGFADFIAKNGHAAPGLAAYFSWPGFFAFIANLAGAAGQHSLLTVMRLWPAAIDLLCLLPLFLIMRSLLLSWRARWLAGFFFTVGNWVGQDYFSPQALNFLLYLVFVAILLNWFTGRAPARRRAGPPWPGWLARLRPGWLARLRPAGPLEPGELSGRTASTAQRAFLLALLIAIYAAATTSHQLSPFYLLGACAALVLVRRSTLPGLPVLLGVILAGWISFAAVAYWSGHMADMFGGIGQIGGNLSVSTGGRAVGSTAAHREVLRARELVAGLIVLLACLGIARRRRRHLDDRVMIALLAMPVLAVGLQSYGGEIVLRSYLFLLPFASILAACLFFPGLQAGRVSWRWLAALAACAVVAPLAFYVARYGNESFERTPTGELTAVDYVYGHAGSGARVLWLSAAPKTLVTPQMPWSYQDTGKVGFVPAQAPLDPASTGGLVSALRGDGRRTYLVAAQTQVSFLQEAAGYGPRWGQRFRASMATSPGVRVAYADASAVVYTARFPPGRAARPPPAVSQAGPALRPTLLTPLGLAVLWLLIAVLAAREFTRACRPAATRLVSRLSMAAWPLLVLMAGIVIARFLVL